MKSTAPTNQTKISPNIILGRERFEKFSAVEGVFLNAEDHLIFAEMDRRKLSNDERRKLIMARLKEAI